MVAEAALDHAIGELDRGVQVFRIVKPVEPKVRPLVEWRQIVARKRVSVSGGTEHGFAPPLGAASEALALRPCQSARLYTRHVRAPINAFDMRFPHRSNANKTA